MDEPRYLHGHHESVLRSHRWRTAQNSAAYLLPHLTPGLDLLDIGCGPGTITSELADLVAPGRVLGIDRSAEVIAAATADHPKIDFAVGDMYALDLADGLFDVVHAHQVLQHVPDQVSALRELRRILRPGGILAARDSIYASKAWSPDDLLLTRWNDLYHQIARRDGGEPDAGRYLLDWVTEAGFVDATYSSSTWTYADAESREWWGGLWAERVRSSAFADHGLEYGLTDRDELERIAEAWQRWAGHPTSTFVVVHGEIIARRQ